MSQSSSMPDFKSLPRNDLIVLVSGVLVFIVSLFFPYYGASIKETVPGFSGSTSTNAWHGLAAFGLILLLLALILVAVQVFAAGSLPDVPLGYAMIAAGLAVLGALCVIIKSFDLPSGSGFGVSYGLRWGGWLLMILVIVQAVFSILRALSSDEGVPWQSSGGAAAPPPPPPPPPTA
jgi:hypothetical protein